jgi:hypothetical protein
MTVCIGGTTLLLLLPQVLTLSAWLLPVTSRSLNK